MKQLAKNKRGCFIETGIFLLAALFIVLLARLMGDPAPKDNTSMLRSSKPKPSHPNPLPNKKSGMKLLTRIQALENQHFPEQITSQMEVVNVPYLDLKGVIRTGQIVVHTEIADEVFRIFSEIADSNFPIDKIQPIVKYGWDDNSSVLDNNTSAFNYRMRIGPGVKKKLSLHSFGVAIDINPYLNPFLDSDGNGESPYDPGVRGTITHDSPPYKIFIKHGWTWGGDWIRAKDYQHFEKKSALENVQQ